MDLAHLFFFSGQDAGEPQGEVAISWFGLTDFHVLGVSSPGDEDHAICCFMLPFFQAAVGE